MKFSTKDQDNDMRPVWWRRPATCAQRYQGGWWYNRCHHCNLNGPYVKRGYNKYGIGLVWWAFRRWHSLKFVEMKIRPYE